MTRLILEEGGKRRAFKVGDGVITIGSGPNAALKLASGGVAELHAELVIQGGAVTLKPKPGVLPPKLGPKALTGDTPLAAGSVVTIGEAKLSIDPPEGGAAPAAAPAVTGGRAAPREKTVEKQEWQRSAREMHSSKGLKPAHMLIILVPLAIVGFFVFKKMAEQDAPNAFQAQTQYFRAVEMLKSGLAEQAQTEIDTISADAPRTPELQAQIEQLKLEIAEARRIGELEKVNKSGTQFLDTQLKNFEAQRMQGKVQSPTVRVFLKRLAEFERRWPQHPELEWVQRQKQIYSKMVDLKAPPTYEDVAFEVETLTWANPRDYKQAFAILQRFVESASADDRVKTQALMDKLTTARKEWYDDRTLQAQHEYKNNQVGKAVSWLLILATYSGDDEMEQTAAKRLLDFPRVDEHLRGYRDTRGDWWPAISANRTIAEWLKTNPL
jgi:predicted negative regulator of RcsB-dependent stress response